ncbi:protein DpdG [Halopseudomonas aestusnigri]|uniref:protein DpdG n=1 Tax=Halopseudomonas aestusnigri TaxID=857252 RepID=UPI0025566E7C|nr:protein DpdG [Halopseudomonas aestusnigri]
MSMVNNAHPGSSLILLNLIDRVLVRRGKPVPRAELLETLRPDLLPRSETGAKRFESNLEFWLEEGLWLQGSEGVILSPLQAGEQSLASRVLELIIKNAVKEPGDAILDGTRTEPFFRAMTCLLAQRRYTFMGGESVNSANAAEAVNSHLPGRGLNESNELSTFLAYGDFLGFLEPFGKGYIVDPTRAIGPYLERIFDGEAVLAVRVFVERLGKCLPLLDGGRYRILLEPYMADWQPDASHEISAALSHALVRLESLFRLRLEKSSDDSLSMRLLLPSGVQRSVGEIHYRAEVAV